MATQDAINQFIAQLQALTAPAANAAQITALQAQIVTLQNQLAAAQQQLLTLQGSDAQTAQQVLQVIQQVLPNRVPGVTAKAAVGP